MAPEEPGCTPVSGDVPPGLSSPQNSSRPGAGVRPVRDDRLAIDQKVADTFGELVRALERKLAALGREARAAG